MRIDSNDAAEILKKYYGIAGTLSSLPGDVDYNYKVEAKSGIAYLLKLSRKGVAVKEWKSQLALYQHLESSAIPIAIPKVITDLNGQRIVRLDSESLMRLQSWVPGKMIAQLSPCTNKLYNSWGAAMGELSKALVGFDDKTLHKEFRWDPSQTLLSRDRLEYFKDAEERELAQYFWNLFEKEALPKLPSLRQSVNHSDGHEMNLLCHTKDGVPVVTGVIDFGDAVYSNTINELAIACAYAGMHRLDPLGAIQEVVRGYNAVFPIEAAEIAVLYYLITARLMITVANAVWAHSEEPENKYLQISAQPAWTLLKQLKELEPKLVEYSLRAVCGYEPSPLNQLFKNWLKDTQPQFHPLVAAQDKTWEPLDLSVGSAELGNNSKYDTTVAFTRTVERMLEYKQAQVGYGGYCETRPIYTSESFKVPTDNGPQWRTVHLGLDIWMEAGTPVYAPWEGAVHSFADNLADGDYGPCIILKHQISDDFCFYTLYGHQSRAAIASLSVGQSIARGEVFSSFGTAEENGGWPPHLHFQIMLDMLGNEGDFPGVAFPHEQEVYASICPDPSLLFPTLPMASMENNTANDLLARRKTVLGKSLSVSYHQPLHIVRGYGSYLYDKQGRRYLDTCNNVAHVGHEHPKVLEAITRQSGLLNTNSRYLHPNIVQYAEELVATLPSSLNVVHFVNSGSEANELALRMARTYKGRKDMIAVEVGYHGSTGACVDVSSYKFDGKGGKGAPEYTQVVPIPDTYRGLYIGEGTGEKYAAHIDGAIAVIEQQGRAVAGFICESILSCGGQIVLPEGYLREDFVKVRAAGGLCIIDEVQVGFGRVGSHFWAFELQGVVPDIVTMGKPIGNGYPLGAVVTTRDVADAFANGMEYFSTYGGNPVACAVGSAVLEVIREEGLQERAQEVGAYLRSALRELQSEHVIIGDVRGEGFFLGFELVKNRETRVPASSAASYLVNRMRELGFLLSSDGPHHNVIKLKPPMCFTKANVDELITYLDKVLKEDVITESLEL